MTDRLEIKAELTVDDAGTITGIAWPFGSPDRVGDVRQAAVSGDLSAALNEEIEQVTA
jgi:hypothetical protein